MQGTARCYAIQDDDDDVNDGDNEDEDEDDETAVSKKKSAAARGVTGGSSGSGTTSSSSSGSSVKKGDTTVDSVPLDVLVQSQRLQDSLVSVLGEYCWCYECEHIQCFMLRAALCVLSLCGRFVVGGGGSDGA